MKKALIIALAALVVFVLTTRKPPQRHTPINSFSSEGRWYTMPEAR